MACFSVGERDWDEQVLASPLPVLVDFWAEWCIPSRTILPAVEAVAASFDGRLRVGRVNVDESPALVARYRIQGLPTLLLLRGPQEAARRVGLMGQDDLTGFLGACL